MRLRHDWTYEEINTIYMTPFNDLIANAHEIHKEHFDPNKIQTSTLLSIKTGACPENCAYCPQSVHYDTGVEAEKLMSVAEVEKFAKKAKQTGSTRFCMGAAWRSPRNKDLVVVCEMIKAVKALGMETCVTLGMLAEEQVKLLEEAGLDYYNHNLDTSPEYYEKIITSRTYQDRLDTLARVRESKIKVCCGGIVGMGESLQDRLGLLQQLANLPEHPPSVPINSLIKIPGTPLENAEEFDSLEFVRLIATARIMMPKSFIRLSAGRNKFSDELHALCFFAGANSIHFGEKLLVTPLPEANKDLNLLQRLGLTTFDEETLKEYAA